MDARLRPTSAPRSSPIAHAPTADVPARAVGAPATARLGPPSSAPASSPTAERRPPSPALRRDALAAFRADEGRWAAHLLRAQDVRALPSSGGAVHAQSFDNSCGANALLAMEDAVAPGAGSGVDPTLREYAAMRAAGFGPEQIYRRADGGAGALGAEAPAGVDSGRGLNYWGMRSAVADRFGAVESNDSAPVDAAITALNGGSPVALGTASHWVAATAVRGAAGQEEVYVRDSWTGRAEWVSAASLRDGTWSASFPGLGELGGPIAAAVYPPPPPSLSAASTQRAAQAAIERGEGT